MVNGNALRGLDTYDKESKMSKLVHTYTTRSFSAEVVESDGKKKVKIIALVWYQNQINKFKIGDKLTLNLTNRKPKRTTQQNNYYWGVYLPLIAKETGEPNIKRLHVLFKSEFLFEGKYEVLGKEIVEIGSTADLSVSGFCEYIMSIESLTGIQAPPTESWGLAPLHDENMVK